MSDITAEKRLELIHSIREENEKNRLNIQNREYILYGRSYDNAGSGESFEASGKSASHLGLRILTAIVLFSLFLIWDYTKGVWFSYTTADVYHSLSENYIANSFDFIEEITYTFNHAE